MIRRVVLVAVAAFAVILAPAAAMANPSLGAAVRSDPAPAPASFTVQVTRAKPNEVVTLTISRSSAPGDHRGARSSIKKANARGVVDFAVTLTEDGTYSIVSTGATGVVLTTQSVTASDHGAIIVAGEGADAAAAAPPAARPPARPARPARPAARPAVRPAVPARPAARPAAVDQLSFTGFDGLGFAVGGGVLLLLGSGAILLARRRQPTQEPPRRS